MNFSVQLIQSRIRASIRALEWLEAHADSVERLALALRSRLHDGGRLYTCGNGGSAAEALHLAEELIGKYRAARRPWPAVCLNADPTALTCIANDFGFASVFERQVEALATERDVLVVFSTSGASENVLRALKAARARRCMTIGLLGRDGGACRAACDHALVVPSDDTAHIQETHQVVLHLLLEAVEAP
jgi:D-sedoheptulose 7-phosphate isomerase